MKQGINVAKNLLGKHERINRKEIMAFLRSQGINADPASAPWCAYFVDACEKAVGKKGTSRANARSFLDYGTLVEKEDAQRGDIIIFTRGGSTWQGHVAYFVEWRDDKNLVLVLGGNQSDKVCYSNYDQGRILGIRRS